MPGYSPALGLPFATDTDVVKQFPTTVDEPRTLAIEEIIKDISGAAGIIARNDLPASWAKFSLELPTGLTGGMTFANGSLVVPVAGWYLISASITRSASGASVAYKHAIGHDTGLYQNTLQAILNDPARDVSTECVVTTLLPLLAGAPVAPWGLCNQPNIPLNSGICTIRYLGPSLGVAGMGG